MFLNTFGLNSQSFKMTCGVLQNDIQDPSNSTSSAIFLLTQPTLCPCFVKLLIFSFQTLSRLHPSWLCHAFSSLLFLLALPGKSFTALIIQRTSGHLSTLNSRFFASMKTCLIRIDHPQTFIQNVQKVYFLHIFIICDILLCLICMLSSPIGHKHLKIKREIVYQFLHPEPLETVP